jgi:hypothetical protein
LKRREYLFLIEEESSRCSPISGSQGSAYGSSVVFTPGSPLSPGLSIIPSGYSGQWLVKALVQGSHCRGLDRSYRVSAVPWDKAVPGVR